MQDRGKLDDTFAAMFSNIKFRSDYLFYAHMIGQCSIKIDETLPAPAGVAFNIDHYELFINPSLYDNYRLEERLFILKHEMLHILYDHVGRKEDRDHKNWNLATDCAINQQANPEHLPENCITPESFEEMFKTKAPKNESSEFYYDLIKENQDEKDSGGEEPHQIDSHEKWQESKGDAELQQDLTKKMIETAQSETIKGKGTVPSEMSDWLKIHSRKSEISWKKVLRGIVGNKKVGSRPTIMKRSRRFPKRDDIKGKTKERKFNLLVVADVSGSMDDVAVLSTLGEVQHICDITKTDVDLIQIDAEAYAPEKLSKKTKLFDRKGNGGTNLHPALEMAKTHHIDYQAVVVLTDGGLWDGDIDHFIALNKKVIWLVEKNGRIMEDMNKGKMKAFQLKD